MRKISRPPVPLPGQGKRGVHGHMAYLLRQANAAVRLTIEHSLAELGVTVPQYLIMTMLRAYPGLSGAELARVALLTPQTIGLITRNLQRINAIEKTARPSHGRALQFTLTLEGAELLDTCRKRARIIEKRITAGLKIEDDAVIRRWLVAIARELGLDPTVVSPAAKSAPAATPRRQRQSPSKD